MTQADSAQALRMSLDSEPTSGQGPTDGSSPSHPGWAHPCYGCRKPLTDPAECTMIGFVEQGSGPGHQFYACLPCARRVASMPGAPEWLRDKVLGGDSA